MYSYASVNCHRTAEGDRKAAAEMKCLNQNPANVEWPFDTYIEPPVTMGQINLDPELPNGSTQFLSNSNGFCYPDYSSEASKNPHNIMLSQELPHEGHGLLLNPENDGITTSLVHNGYALYEPCSSGMTGFEQGNSDLMKGYAPPFPRGYDPGYQEMGCHEFQVPPPHPNHPNHPPRLHHSNDPSLDIGCRGAKENSQFLNSLQSLNGGDVTRSTGHHEDYHRCYDGVGDLPSVMPHPPFIKSPGPSVSLMDISQSHLDDGLHHEVIRRRRRREQNRIAARKCREKKKENVDNMLKDYTETLRENERLRLETEKLQNLVASLQTIVKSHQTTCNFSSAAAV